MKNSRNERLSEHLLNVDEELLTTAYEIDNAEKLKAYKKSESARGGKPIYIAHRKPVWIPIVAAAACVALTVGLWQGGVFDPAEIPVEVPNEGTSTTEPTESTTEPTTDVTEVADTTTDIITEGTDTAATKGTESTTTAPGKPEPTKTEKPTTVKTTPKPTTKPTTTISTKPTTAKPTKPPAVIISGTTTKTSVTNTTTNKDKRVITADEPDTYSSLEDEAPVMSVKGVYISPALEKKMKQYRGENVLYSVIVELPICLEDGDSLETSAEWIAWEKEFSDVCDAFDAEAKRLNPSYDGMGPIKVWSDELYALRKQWDEVVAKRDELIKKYQETEHPIIRNQRVDFLKWIAGTEIVPISTDERFYPFFANDPNYAFFAELTAEEINTLTEQGGYVFRLKFLDGDKKGVIIDD